MTTTLDDTGLVPPLDCDAFTALLAEISIDDAPRRFALCEVRDDPADGRVFCYGLAFPDRAVTFDLDGTGRLDFSTAGHAHSALSRHTDLRLIWLDPGAPELGDAHQAW